VLASVFMGLAIAPDNQTIYVAGGQENLIYIFDVNSGEKTDSILVEYCPPDDSQPYFFICLGLRSLPFGQGCKPIDLGFAALKGIALKECLWHNPVTF